MKIHLRNGGSRATSFAIRLGGTQYTLSDALFSCRYGLVACGRVRNPHTGSYFGADSRRFYHPDPSAQNKPVLDISSSRVYIAGGYLQAVTNIFVFTDTDSNESEEIHVPSLAVVPGEYEGGLKVDNITRNATAYTAQGQSTGSDTYTRSDDGVSFNGEAITNLQESFFNFCPVLFTPCRLDGTVRFVGTGLCYSLWFTDPFDW